MSSLAIMIKTAKNPNDFSKSGQPRQNIHEILRLIKGILGGVLQGGIYIQSSTSDPVASFSTVTTTFASLVATDTLVILGVTLTCVTTTPTTDQFQKLTDDTTTCVNIKNCINANTTLARYVTATSALGVVTITCNQRGALGNFLAPIAKTGTGLTLAQWSAGTGGAATAPVQIRG